MKISKKLNREAIGEDSSSIEIYKSKDTGKLCYKNDKNTIISIEPDVNPIVNTLTISPETPLTIAGFDASSQVKSLTTTTYPDLTELSYVKGVTSSIQTQINSKQATITAATEQSFIDALTISPAPLDTMMIQVTDPASTTVKKFSWANIKVYLLSYFDTVFPRKTVASTGSVISFEVPVIWNTFGTPSTANLTDDLTNAKIGYIQKIYHNKAVEPTYPAGWVKMGTGTYTNGVLNVIFAEWVSGTRVEYWITKPA